MISSDKGSGFTPNASDSGLTQEVRWMEGTARIGFGFLTSLYSQVFFILSHISYYTISMYLSGFAKLASPKLPFPKEFLLLEFYNLSDTLDLYETYLFVLALCLN